MDLPTVWSCLEIQVGDHPLELIVVAVDLDQGVWTCLSADDDLYHLYTFDENGNWRMLPDRRFKTEWELRADGIEP